MPCLDDIYDGVGSDILRANPFPNPESDFAMVWREEQWRNTILNNNTNSNMAIVATIFFFRIEITIRKLVAMLKKGYTHCGNPKCNRYIFNMHGHQD